VSTLSLWREVFGLDKQTVISSVYWDPDDDAVVARVRPNKRYAPCCGRCGAKAPKYDNGDGERRWRSMDVGATPAYLEGLAPRVNCPDHGPTVVLVPWARHGSRQTSWFEDQVAWLAVHTSKFAVSMLMRIAWVTVGVSRVGFDGDPFALISRTHL